jgi:hypothetical protein
MLIQLVKCWGDSFARMFRFCRKSQEFETSRSNHKTHSITAARRRTRETPQRRLCRRGPRRLRGESGRTCTPVSGSLHAAITSISLVGGSEVCFAVHKQFHARKITVDGCPVKRSQATGGKVRQQTSAKQDRKTGVITRCPQLHRDQRRSLEAYRRRRRDGYHTPHVEA